MGVRELVRACVHTCVCARARVDACIMQSIAAHLELDEAAIKFMHA